MPAVLNFLPLGDQAVLAYFESEPEALVFARRVRQVAAPWLVDVVQSYASVAVFFDLAQINFDQAANVLKECTYEKERFPVSGKLYVIPCCYELAFDLNRVAKLKELSSDEVIRLHCQIEYGVFAIGFCPGFPYLGYLPDRLAGVPRLPSPRLHVEEGSVGLAGRQTGIYTMPKPGGWNVIGRTPLQLVDVEDEYFPIQVGDRVRFTRIDEREFARLAGERISSDGIQ